MRCAVPGCGRSRRAYDYCAKHGVAVRKYGDPLGQSPRNRKPGERFGAWTLIERLPTRGWLCRCDCGVSRVLWLSSVTSGRSSSCGTCHTRRGRPPRKAEPSYSAVHRRLRVDRGLASTHPCTDCGQPAGDWSYDGLDPDELTATSWWGKPIAYSVKQEHYVPRCKPCHSTYDRRRARKALA